MLSNSCAAGLPDATLPVVNVKYEFAAEDTPTGGMMAQEYAGILPEIAFRKDTWS